MNNLAWATFKTANGPTENGCTSNSGYHHDLQTEVSRDAQNGMTSTANSSSLPTLGSANGLQTSAYASYPTTSDLNGFEGTGYANYPAHGYPSQSTHSYPQAQQMGSYPTSGAPPHRSHSFQVTSPCGPSTNYPSTHYNAAADYQTGGYESSSYANQNNSCYGYGNYQYPSFPSDSVGVQNPGATTPTPLQYQPQYQHWANNMIQNQSASDVSCAPGTENISVTTASTMSCAVPGISGGYPWYPASNQPPPPGTTPWRPNSTPSEISSVQSQLSSSVVNNHGGSWKAGTHVFQTNIHQMPPSYQKSTDSSLLSHEIFENQQKTACPQASNQQFASIQEPNAQFSNTCQTPSLQLPSSHHSPTVQYHISHQIPQNFQSSLQTGPTSDTRRTNKLQIQTNPRIASSLPFGMQKTDKDGSISGASSKPAYISISTPKDNKVSSHDASDTAYMPGTFPKSFCAYVERALARCKDDDEKAACQNVLKEVTTKAREDGTLFTRNWDIEPFFLATISSANLINKDNQQNFAIGSHRKSPSRRTKSRWEPIPEEKLTEKLPPVGHDPEKDASWDRLRERDRAASSGKFDVKDYSPDEIKFFPYHKHALPNRSDQKQVKKKRLSNGSSVTVNDDASSESDKDQGLGAYLSGAIALANSPEERKRRENRSKRFDKGHGHRADIKYFKPKGKVESGDLCRNSAPFIKEYEDGSGRAVEDMDWDSLTVKGTCQEIEKGYLRLTSAPDPSTVRPEEVLEKALSMVENSHKNYLYKCDQLKSIRQDLTVQRIRNELTVKVYETHARLALEAGDLPEYNQCQSQLQSLYTEGIRGCHMEFYAYNLLCVILHSSNNRDLLSSMARLSSEARKDDAVKHALGVRAAVKSGNYVLFFRLYKKAPNLNTCLMDLYVERMRFEAVKCMSRSYRPSVPVVFVARALGFMNNRSMEVDGEDSNGLEECEEWLKAHGAIITIDSNGERQVDTKVTSSSLYMPEPEDAVAHGDTNLAVNDFLTRTS